MSHGKTGRSTLGPSIFAIALLISSQVLFAAPLWHSKTTPTALGPGSVAIVPFVFYGKVDQELTNSFLEQLTSLKTTSRIVDDTSFASHLGKGVNNRSDAPLPALLKAAKAANAEVLILGQAKKYKFLEAPGVSLRVKVISVATGSELHRNLTKESAWTLPGAKREAGSTAAKQMVKHWREQ